MQFSKRVSELSRLYGIDPKDVLFAMLATSGASTAEAFAVIYRPAVSTSSALATKASNYIGQKPGLRKLIDELNAQSSDDPNQAGAKRRGRPRKATAADSLAGDRQLLDYTDKDAVLKEYADIVVTAEKVGDKLSALNGIATLQRMKQEAKIEEEKRVQFYIPLSYTRCDELLCYLQKYYADKEEKESKEAEQTA